ncbi:MAG: hypothetical protein ACRDT8_25655 [Micromonosporaceae bacterium]
MNIEDGHAEPAPPRPIPPDQAWFWTEEWQAGEREVDRDLANGVRGQVFYSDDEILDALERGIDDPSTLR